jgi:beta,beta-carotene 9',10'-dioxygenase
MLTQAAVKKGTRHKGLETLDDEVRVDALPVRGELPGWLAGRLVRVTPAMLDVGGTPLRHWFDGLAMLNAFSIAEGGVSYGSRYLRTDAYRGAREGRFDAWGFGQDPCRSLFKRVMTAMSAPDNDNTNVNLTALGDRYLAMTELPIPVEFDPETLETVGPVKWGDGVGGHSSSAHPHHDPARDELLSYVVHYSGRSSYRLFALPAGDTRRREIVSIPAREPAYIHSFAMTERYLVLVEWPLVVDPVRMIARGGSFMDNMSWKPERGTRFHVVDRHRGELRGTYEGEPFYCFHHVNAFEREDEVVIDLCAFDDPSVIGTLELDELRGDGPTPPVAQPRRYRVPLGGGEVRGESLSEEGIELPRIDYGRHNGRPYRYAYGAGIRGSDSDWLDRVVKIDVETGEARSWWQDGCYPGEPVFVPAPRAGAEDDGVVLTVVLDSAAGHSFLAVLDAVTLEEVARAEAPHHIPFGFHGQFFAGEET